MNGLRVSEATGADIEHLGLERGHRTLTITRTGRHDIPAAINSPGHRQGHDLAVGLQVLGGTVLTCRRPPSTESALRLNPLILIRKGGKVVTIPLAPPTARALDLAIGERIEGPVFLARDGRRLDRHGAGRIVRKTALRTGIGKPVTPHTLRHAFITAAFGRRGAAPRYPGGGLTR